VLQSSFRFVRLAVDVLRSGTCSEFDHSCCRAVCTHRFTMTILHRRMRTLLLKGHEKEPAVGFLMTVFGSDRDFFCRRNGSFQALWLCNYRSRVTPCLNDFWCSHPLSFPRVYDIGPVTLQNQRGDLCSRHVCEALQESYCTRLCKAHARPYRTKEGPPCSPFLA
jgi:hypothetical protein